MAENEDRKKKIKSVKTLAMVNVGIWAIAIIAMVFLAEKAPIATRLFPILAGGVAVGVSVVTAAGKLE